MRMIKSNIVCEEMDGELLAIDDLTGTYVSVSGSGTWLWAMLAQGADAASLKQALPPAVHADVDQFIAAVEEAGLMVDADTAAAPEPDTAEPDTAAPDPWVAPGFERFDDLQDLLLLDPIHEVADAGWPRAGDPT